MNTKKFLINKSLELYNKYQIYKVNDEIINFINSSLDIENEIY